MPTATGRPTADEKRETDRIKHREARRQVSAKVTTPDWVKAEADAFEALVAAGEAKREYPIGSDHKVGRIVISEGQARQLAVADELERRGIRHSVYTSFGVAAGRQSIMYGLRRY